MSIIKYYWQTLTAGVVFIAITIPSLFILVIYLLRLNRRLERHFRRLEKKWDKEEGG